MQFKEPPPLPSRPAMSIGFHPNSMTTPPTPQQMSMAERLHLLGARSALEFPDQVEALKRIHRQQVVWIIDGLDQIAIPNDPRQSRLVATINLLSASAPTIVSCRPEVWDAIYVQQLSISARTIPDLDYQRVRTLFFSATNRPLPSSVPLLRTPFFLRIAIEKAPQWTDFPETEMRFLAAIWRDIIASNVQATQDVLPSPSQRGIILDELARLQLENLAYETPLAILRQACAAMTDFSKDFNALKATGMLMEIPRGSARSEVTVRLRHDLLDCYGMVRRLMESSLRNVDITRLFDNLDRDGVWTVLATLARFLHEYSNTLVKRAMFEKMLYILDRKECGTQWKAKSWLLTYTLRSSIEALKDLILESIGGTLIDPVTDAASTQGSSLGPAARITQLAGSTLASAFLSVERGTTEDAQRIVPVIEHALKSWVNRARLIDTLGRYPITRSLELIVAVADSELSGKVKKPDPEVLEYIAQNLQNFNDERAVVCLQRILDASGLSSRIYRLASISLKSLCPGLNLTIPEITMKEIVEDLKPTDSRGNSSDWKKVQEAAIAARMLIMRTGQATPELIAALVKALDHTHNYVRCPVSETLSLLDDPLATYALLNELQEPETYEDVRQAGTKALRRQLFRMSSPLSRQRLRFLMLMGARLAQQNGRESIAASLTEGALKAIPDDPTPWAADEHALQVASLSPTGMNISISLRPPDARQLPIDPEIDAHIRSSTTNVGPNLEPKYRVAEWRQADGQVHLVMEETTWTEARQFHQLILTNPRQIIVREDRTWLEPIPWGTQRLPGLAVVHAIVLTSDDQLLLMQRSSNAKYAPRHWSASFEEQMTKEDFASGASPALQAAARGFYEEFGLKTSLNTIRELGILLELNLCNLGIIVLIQAPWTAQQIAKRWQEEPRPKDWDEAKAVYAIPIDCTDLDQFMEAIEHKFLPLHPTSRLRIRVLIQALRSGGTI